VSFQHVLERAHIYRFPLQESLNARQILEPSKFYRDCNYVLRPEASSPQWRIASHVNVEFDVCAERHPFLDRALLSVAPE